jgi:hypothetical protein
LVAWLEKSGGPALTIAFFSALAALLSAGVALVQMLLLLNERSTPYRVAVHAAQVEAGQNVSATAVQFWEALSAGMAGCRGAQSGDYSWEESSRARMVEEARAYYEFRKAMYAGRTVFSPSVVEVGRPLSDVIYGVSQTYGSRTCEESVTLEDKFQADTKEFEDAYFAFLNAVRADASIDLLSDRPDMQMPR